MVNLPVPEGELASAYFFKATQGTDSYLLVFHEWWGLNDHIKKQVDQLSEDLPNLNNWP